MSADAQMQKVGELDGRTIWWAEPGRFAQPGLYWSTEQFTNVPVELPPAFLPPRDAAKDGAFCADLAGLINKHSMENGSNTPDFMLAAFLTQCLAAFDQAVDWRQRGRTDETVRDLDH
ncbi:MAG TPA: hypothetical protein VGB70_12920 [Allosphingosinicella sp.]|jgi:hypothetical protein